MNLTNPYFRLYRLIDTDESFRYLLDKRYSPDRITLIHSFSIIEKDLKELFDFVQPSESNKTIYSHRLFELLLRACTELETNFKGILEANGYQKNNLNIQSDFFKLNEYWRFSDYEIRLDIWTPTSLTIKPFESWKNGYTPLAWYQAYNNQGILNSGDIDHMGGSCVFNYLPFLFNCYGEIHLSIFSLDQKLKTLFGRYSCFVHLYMNIHFFKRVEHTRVIDSGSQ